MNTKLKKLPSLIVGLALGMGATQAHASLLRLEFTNQRGEPVKLVTPDKVLTNAQGIMHLSIAAGLSRKVEATIYNLGGEVVETTKSSIIQVEHKIDSNQEGIKAYGQTLQLNIPSQDGKYRLVTRILGSQDTVAQENSIDFTVDKTPPSITGPYQTIGAESYANVNNEANIYNHLNSLAGASNKVLHLKGIEDLSGIKSVNLTTYYASGPNKGRKIKTIPAIYDPISKSASLTLNLNLGIFPQSFLDYKVEFAVEDLAGNIALYSHTHGYADKCLDPKPVPVAIKDPTSTNKFLNQIAFTGFVPWQNGGVIKQNPPEIIWSVPKANLYPTNKYGYVNKPAFEDNNNGYIVTRGVPLLPPGVYSDRARGNFYSTHVWGCLAYDTIKGTLARNVQQTPRISRFELRTTDKNYNDPIDSRPITNNPFLSHSVTNAIFLNRRVALRDIKVNVEPKPYVQLVEAAHRVQHMPSTLNLKNMRCEVPINQTYCVVPVNAIWDHRKYSAMSFSISPKNNPTLKAVFSYAIIVTDYSNPPEIVRLDYDKETKQGIIHIYDNDAENGKESGGHFWWKPAQVKVNFVNKMNNLHKSIEINSIEKKNTNDFQAKFSLNDFEEGQYELVNIEVLDNFRNKSTKQLNPQDHTGTTPYIYIVDKTVPVIEALYNKNNSSTVITTDEMPLLNSFDELTFKVTDKSKFTVDYISVSYVRKSEDANKAERVKTVNVGHRLLKDGVVQLEYPLAFPAVSELEKYRITISVKDEAGNRSTKTVEAKYDPPRIQLASGVNGKLYLPAVVAEFFHNDQMRMIDTLPITLSNNSIIQGNFDVTVTLKDDSSIPLYINDRLVVPGQSTIFKNFNFTASQGKLSIPVKPAETGLVGKATIMLSTTAPNSPVLVADIQTWNGSVELKSPTWEYRQVLDQFNITALPGEGTICRITSSEEVARRSSPIKDPVCLLEWTQIPEDAMPIGTDGSSRSITAGLRGHSALLGTNKLKYNLSIYNGRGEKYFLTQGEKDVEIVSAVGAITVEPANASLVFKRQIQDVNLTLRHAEGVSCRLTLDSRTALNSWTRGNDKTRFCLVEWLTLPDGLAQSQNHTFPFTTGKMDTNGSYDFSYRINAYSNRGVKFVISEQSGSFSVTDPVRPSIEFDSAFKQGSQERTFMVPMKRGRLGDLNFVSDKGDITVVAKEGERVLDRVEYPNRNNGSSEDTNKGRYYFPFTNSQLHDKRIYTAEVFYKDLPELGVKESYTVYTVPDNTIKPTIEVSKQAVSTDALPVRVRMMNTQYPRAVYSEGTMGRWKVRLMQDIKDQDPQALTDFAEMENGVATFDLDVNAYAKINNLRIFAEAVWLHNIPGYEHKERSNQVSNIQMLSGLPIDARIVSRKISGPAPFQSIFNIALDNIRERSNISLVEWQISSNGGATWTAIPMNNKVEMQLRHTFGMGTHQIRAVIENKFSKAKSSTEIIEVVAYQTANVEIVGPQSVLIGDKVTLEANPYMLKELTEEQEQQVLRGDVEYNEIARQTIPLEQVDIEWSTDGGKTYNLTGKTIELSSDTQKVFSVFARVKPKEAPADDRSAYKTVQKRVAFERHRPANISISGEGRLELGKEYTFKVQFAFPYRNFEGKLNYEILLPNGEKIQDSVLTTEAVRDVVVREFKYTLSDKSHEGLVEFVVNAHMDRFEETTKSRAVFTARTWTYIWPNFGLNSHMDVSVVPAQVRFEVRPIGFSGELDNPTYTWEIPEGVQHLPQAKPAMRIFIVKEAGTYPIKAIVRDARGNERILQTEFTVSNPEPYVTRLQPTYSNRYMREPLDVRVRAFARGGHPKDKLHSGAYSLNGQANNLTGNFTGLMAGTHTIRFTTRSEMGQEIAETLEFEVKRNMPPVCSPVTARKTISSLSAIAACRDEDGRIVAHEWLVNGQKVANTSSRLTANISRNEPLPTITVQAIDDTGTRSQLINVTVPQE